ncbi:PepSY domain-containing protein [Planctomycetes bacterium K23_9]|uniref:PepSY-associated TM helix n=1 Tax=Stieleria marina TaxID=1930275 RepID=A0A517NNK0_9BACT|nr:hypothetical protein K239x_06480 [Planctomycetes bacterium K23_9]
MPKSTPRSADQQNPPSEQTATDAKPQKKSKRWPPFKILIRRIHLYAGLFLLPWVFLYGITGAMYNHIGLFPETDIRDVAAESLTDTPLADFPSAAELAANVVAAINATSPESTVELVDQHGAAFNNPIILEVKDKDLRHDVYVDPATKLARVVTHSQSTEIAEPLLKEIRNIQLKPNPYQVVKQSVPDVLDNAGIDSSNKPKPRGWSKLNFLASVDGEPARITYVLRDGHIDVVRFKGQDGMSPRAFFLRLHTSHGQPPHWNARQIWSLFVDIMAIAMVTWGLTGLFMWWQLKRTRVVGAIVIAASLATAATLYFAMMNYYAVTVL